MPVPRQVGLKLARNAIVLWMAVRVLWVAVCAFVGIQATVAPFPFGIVVFPALVLAVAWIEVFASGERIIIADLGVRPGAVTSIVLGVAVALEAVTGVVLVSGGFSA